MVTSVLTTTTPAEAEVWEGTEQVGVTPLTLTDLEDTFRTLEIRAKGFIPMVVEWRLGSGDREVALSPLPKRRYSRYRRRRSSSPSTPAVEPAATVEETIPAVDPVEAAPPEAKPAESVPAVFLNGKDQ